MNGNSSSSLSTHTDTGSHAPHTPVKATSGEAPVHAPINSSNTVASRDVGEGSCATWTGVGIEGIGPSSRRISPPQLRVPMKQNSLNVLSPVTPRSTMMASAGTVASLGSPLPTPRSGTAAPMQDCVSVVVRLKPASSAAGGNGSGGGSRAMTPTSSTMGPLQPGALEYAMEDGTLNTPRTGRRAASTAAAAAMSSPCEPPDVDGGAASTAGSGFSTVIGTRGRLLTVTSPAGEDRRQYEFGEVLGPDVPNAAVCDRLLPSVTAQLAAGYNVCLLCYGQTGSGKTHTANALVPAVAEAVFKALDVNNDVVEMSYIQIYNNKAYTLLDGTRAGRLGTELSKPQVHSSSSIATASEPRVLVRSAGDVATRLRAGAKMRVTHAHALNVRSSRSFTLLTLHITRFLDGAALTTTRVTLADLAGTERLKKSGVSGEGQEQAIFINKSLMALRELVEATGPEQEVLHYRDALLTAYLAPRMRSWHLMLVVTVSLDASNYDETKSSLDFATNARRRRVRKTRNRLADRLCVSSARYSGRLMPSSPGRGGLAEEADAVELQSVVEALRYRIHVLEESLRTERQRAATLDLPQHQDVINNGKDAQALSYESGSEDLLKQAEATIARLRAEAHQCRQLLWEREEALRGLQPLLGRMESGETAQPLSPISTSVSFTSGGPDGEGTMDTPILSTFSEDTDLTSEAPGTSAVVDSEDVYAQLSYGLRVLRSRLLKDEEAEALTGRLHNAVLRAREQFEEMRERLLVVASSLGGMRAQNHELREAELVGIRARIAQTEVQTRLQKSLRREQRRSAAAESAVEQLRLELFQAHASQPIAEELTRFYLDARPAMDPGAGLSGTQLAEHREEVEKLRAHQRTLQGKVTELVNTVAQLTRSALQRDVALTTLASLLTPAQRVLFHSMTQVQMEGGEGGVLPTSVSGPTQLPPSSTSISVDGFALLQSRVSELQAALAEERQQHRLTRCEGQEARADARRARLEQRQAFFQHQEERRCVVQLTADNHDLRQLNERHQLYLDQVHVSFQEQLLELRRYHLREVAEAQRTWAEAATSRETAAVKVPDTPRTTETVADQYTEDSYEHEEKGETGPRHRSSWRSEEDEEEPVSTTAIAVAVAAPSAKPSVATHATPHRGGRRRSSSGGTGTASRRLPGTAVKTSPPASASRPSHRSSTGPVKPTVGVVTARRK